MARDDGRLGGDTEPAVELARRFHDAATEVRTTDPHAADLAAALDATAAALAAHPGWAGPLTELLVPARQDPADGDGTDR